MGELGSIQKQKLEKLFNLYDVDSNNKIELNDLMTVADNFAVVNGWGKGSQIHKKLQNQYQDLWSKLKTHADIDKTNAVSKQEWLSYWDNIIGSEMGETLIKEFALSFFSLLDVNNDGSIEFEEYRNIMFAFESNLDNVENAFHTLDTEGEGKLDLNTCLKLGLAFFRSNDKKHPGNHIFGIINFE